MSILGEASSAYGPDYPHPGWAEQSPTLWEDALAPTIEALSEQYEGQLKVGMLNVDENSETAAEYGISSIPAVLLFDKGKVVERFVGIQPKERYASAVATLVGVGSETQ